MLVLGGVVAAQLAAGGVDIGAHFDTHRSLDAVLFDDLLKGAYRSHRRTLARESLNWVERDNVDQAMDATEQLSQLMSVLGSIVLSSGD